MAGTSAILLRGRSIKIFDEAAKLYPGDRRNLPPPSAEQYAKALAEIAVTDTQVETLRLHYASHERTITADQMSAAFGYSHHGFANSKYGTLGRRVGAALEYNPFHERVGTLVTFEWRGQWHWIMRPEVARALELLGWIAGPEILLPQETAALIALPEGGRVRVFAERYERDRRLVQQCKNALATKECCICEFSFEATYGEIAKDFIEVHHVRPLSEVGENHMVNPLTDLAAVCPNCHAVLHMRRPAYSIEEVRRMLRRPGET